MTRKTLAIALIACGTLVASAVTTRDAVADIVNGVATQDLFQNASVGRRGSTDSAEFDPPDSMRPTGSSGIVGIANFIEVGPVLPDAQLPGPFPGTTAIATASGRSDTTFNTANDIEVELSAVSSMTSIDTDLGIAGTYSSNVQADSIFTFQVDEITDAMLEATVNPKSASSGWQIRLFGGPAGFVVNRLTDPGAGPLSITENVTLFPGFDYILRANVLTSASASQGAGNFATAESIDFRFRTLSSVPEPNAAAIFGFGAMLALVSRKKRRA